MHRWWVETSTTCFLKENFHMSKSNKFVKKSSSGKPNSKLIIVLSCIAAALLILVVALILLIPKEEVPAETIGTYRSPHHRASYHNS